MSAALDFLMVLAIVLVGNVVGSFFYLHNLLSGVDVSALFSRPHGLSGLLRWFALNTLVGLFLSIPCLLYIDKYALVLVFVLSVIPAALSFAGREVKATLLQLRPTMFNRIAYEKIFNGVLKFQTWAIRPFLDVREDVVLQKNQEVMDITEDLRFVFTDKELAEVLHNLIYESLALPPSLRQKLQKMDTLSGQLQVLVKFANLDILRFILLASDRVGNELRDQPQIRHAHQQNREIFDSVQHVVVHFSADSNKVEHLNKTAKCFIEETGEFTDDWSLIGKACNELLSGEECQGCILAQDVPRMSKSLDLPCKFGKCRIHPLKNARGLVLVKELEIQ